MKQNRYEALDGLRAFACIGIVMMHVLVNGKYQLNGFLFEKMIPSFTSFVYLFMTISGFGMCCGYYEKFLGKNIDIVSFYHKRYAKILPFFSVLCLIDLAMSPGIGALYEVIANLTLCFGLIPNAHITVIGVGWFLGVVFAFYLLFPFYCALLSSKVKAWMTLIVSFIMNYLCSVYFGAGMKSIVFCFVFFVVGGLIYLYRQTLNETIWIKWISFGLVVALTLVYFFINDGVIVISLFNAAIVAFAISRERKSVLNNKITKFIGGISFEVYLCHMLIYRCVEKVHLLRITTNEGCNYFIAVVVVFIGAVMFAFIGQKAIRTVGKLCKNVKCIFEKQNTI